MLSQPNKKNIKKKLNSIYRLDYSKQDLGVYANEIFRVINIHNKFVKKRKKIKISEKTSVLICYADSLLNGNRGKTIKIFKKFYKKKLDHFFEIFHFLPFYPSSSDLAIRKKLARF